MTTKVKRRILAELEAIEADFPRRKKAAEKLLRQHGLTESLKFEADPPDAVVDLPTFDTRVFREPTPMLKARFEYAGSLKRGTELWLGATGMASCMKQKELLSYHTSLREHWEGSAPMIFDDDRLSLFGVTEGVPENLIYLVWVEKAKEPEVWVYEGLDSHRFRNLAQYLKWCLERE